MAIFGSKKEEKGESTQAPAVTATVATPLILLGARLSEKSSRLAHNGKYIFNVKRRANKVEIKKAVEKTYHVNVTQVNILNTQGKAKTSGRIMGRTSPFKKAIVTLKHGQKIEGAEATV